MKVDNRMTDSDGEVYYNEKESQNTPDFIKNIFERVTVIENIILNSHSLILIKNEIYQWQEIIFKVLAILADHFDPKNGMVGERYPINIIYDQYGVKSEIKHIGRKFLYVVDWLCHVEKIFSGK